MESGTSSKLEYLKKYLDKPKKSKGTKSKKHEKQIGLSIVDEGDGLDKSKNLDELNIEGDDEAPLVVLSDGTTISTSEMEQKMNSNANKWLVVGPDSVDSKTSSHIDFQPPSTVPIHSSTDQQTLKTQESTKASNYGLKVKTEPILKNGDRDISPPRRKPSVKSDFSVSVKVERGETVPEVIFTGDGNKRPGGLSSKAEMLKSQDQDDLIRKRKIETLNPEITGRDASTVVRESGTGRKIDMKLESIKKKRLEDERNRVIEKYCEWGRGLKQRQNKELTAEDEALEMTKPLARYADDPDLEKRLKDELREGDPMLQYLSKPSKHKNSNESERPKYKGPMGPHNRFGISPGYRWDGVDRSNGFERTRFKRIAELKAIRTDAYMWSVEDM